ncbi:MAG TPA: peptidylprolyl isomerase [Acidimicrobiales bacterium]|nr:peptidylprolyl isomerase [Acidimicrobiales bacterium]
MSRSDRRHGRDAAHRRAHQAAAREAARRRQRRIQRIVVGIVAIVVVGAVLLTAIPGDGGDDVATTPGETTSTTSTTTAPVDEAAVTPIADEPVDPEASFDYGAGECAPDRKPDERPASFDEPFASCLTEGARYKAVVGTSEGSFTIDLLPRRAPGTVNNFVQLARWGWFDGDDFHRVEPGFVIQGGDPVGDPPGTGGPGYAIADELPGDDFTYGPGTVAMANSGPDTNGSQWFVCVGCTGLPPSYSVFGWVSSGMDVVRAINARAGGEVAIVAIEVLENPLAVE